MSDLDPPFPYSRESRTDDRRRSAPPAPTIAESIASLIRELAIYEKLEGRGPKATPEDSSATHLFGERPFGRMS